MQGCVCKCICVCVWVCKCYTFTHPHTHICIRTTKYLTEGKCKDLEAERRLGRGHQSYVIEKFSTEL